MARESAAYLQYLEEADHEAHGGFDEAAYDRWTAAEAKANPPPTLEEELAFQEAAAEYRDLMARRPAAARSEEDAPRRLTTEQERIWANA